MAFERGIINILMVLNDCHLVTYFHFPILFPIINTVFGLLLLVIYGFSKTQQIPFQPQPFIVIFVRFTERVYFVQK